MMLGSTPKGQLCMLAMRLASTLRKSSFWRSVPVNAVGLMSVLGPAIVTSFKPMHALNA